MVRATDIQEVTDQAIPDALTEGTAEDVRQHRLSGVEAPWYQGWDITDEKRQYFRDKAINSAAAKRLAMQGGGPEPIHDINVPNLLPQDLMPQQTASGLRALSLFSGGGGLDLGYDRAGFGHVASFEILEHAAETLQRNREHWDVFTGDDGDVTAVDWLEYAGKVDVVHGGPPCQPFSVAGRQQGVDDVRDMFPEFVRCVLEISPRAFMAENVAAVGKPKFAGYVQETIYEPLRAFYDVHQFELSAEAFGVPQARRRVFFVGIRKGEGAKFYVPPAATHSAARLTGQQEQLGSLDLAPTMGAREALGLPNIGFDALSPTLRSGLSSPRKTTSILNSTSAKRVWDELQIWPNGVAKTRAAARAFVPECQHFRLSVADCGVLQGFPEDWTFPEFVYKAVGQIGNSVAPPVAYQVALSIRQALS